MATVAFIGAGSVVFTRELLADIFGYPELAGVRIVLHDIDPERLETADAVARRLADQMGARADITSTLDRRTALDGADYVINVVQVGMYAATRLDFDLPARHGLRQTVADTIGVGGIFRGLRTFPVLAGLAADMREVCPDAWLLNYTNPDGHERDVSFADRTRAQGARPVPLGLLDRPWAVQRGRRPIRGRHLSQCGSQPPGVDPALGA
jgi:alpha-galactosidase